jgi:hypothetical protein
MESYLRGEPCFRHFNVLAATFASVPGVECPTPAQRVQDGWRAVRHAGPNRCLRSPRLCSRWPVAPPTPTRSATFSWRPALEPSQSLRLISSFNPGLKPWITCRWASPPRRGRSGVRRSRRRRPPRLSLMRSGRRLKRRRPKHGRSARRRLQPQPRPPGVLRQLRFAGRTESIKKAATAVARCYEARSIASRGAFLRTTRI